MRAAHVILFAAVFSVLVPSTASAHCDTYDGPVVKAGQRTLETGDLVHALIWIKPAAEPELRAAFERSRKVRDLGPDARELADRFFLETLVRLHRAGEGEPYTGLKPKGTDLGPVIPVADEAITSGSSRALRRLIMDQTAKGLEHRLELVTTKRKFKVKDVQRGREYVEAYVTFMHYAERLYDAATAKHTPH
jgi:hypothetical protein